MTQPKGLHRVRWIVGEEPEMQCAECFEYLAMTLEFWDPWRGVRRCRLCYRESEKRNHSARAKLRRQKKGQPMVTTAYMTDWRRRNRGLLARYQRGDLDGESRVMAGKQEARSFPTEPPTLERGHTVSATCKCASLHVSPLPSARRAAGGNPERRSTAHPRPCETRPVAERPGAVDYGVTADLGPSTERAERTPRRTADASDTPLPGNGGRVPRYRSAFGSASGGDGG